MLNPVLSNGFLKKSITNYFIQHTTCIQVWITQLICRLTTVWFVISETLDFLGHHLRTIWNLVGISNNFTQSRSYGLSLHCWTPGFWRPCIITNFPWFNTSRSTLLELTFLNSTQKSMFIEHETFYSTIQIDNFSYI